MPLRMFCLALTLVLASAAFAQNAVDRDKATTTISGKNITIEYGRPALKGRTFDQLMKQLPADRMWRAGSGQVTLLSTETPLIIGGKKIAAGKYSLYIHCPEQGEYSLVINKDPGQPLGKIWAAAPADQAKQPYPHFEYQKEIGGQEVARVPMKKETGSTTEVFTISLKPAKSGAMMLLSWGDRNWSLELIAVK